MPFQPLQMGLVCERVWFLFQETFLLPGIQIPSFLFPPESSCSYWLPYRACRGEHDLSGCVQYVRALYKAAGHQSMKWAEHERLLILCLHRGARVA